MGKFKFSKTKIESVLVVEPQVFADDRGFFFECYKTSDFAVVGIKGSFSQVNHSRSTKGVLRGLHYQSDPMAQGKLVKVVAGEVFDVAVDLRKSSPTFGRWVGEDLSADNKKMLYIPEGFAHGFCVTSDIAEVVYFVIGGEYSPEHDRGIIWNDPDVGIKWPLKEISVSKKDKVHPCLKDAEIFS
ncbi:MAG: dTDP-4-dehydrorhamnose 3,5-epimerase [Candidatus Margulisiibacteriota bacterium]|nr:dTDP-4-dehydrorhamnose 3,5-epimerase [Candidatus Margulisiibacteriota bacterium]